MVLKPEMLLLSIVGLTRKRTTTMLSQAESMRLKADYDAGVKIDKGECEDILENCEFFLNKVKETIKELQT